MGCFLSNKKHGLRLTADFSKRLPFLGQIDWLLVVVVFLFKISSSFSNAGMWEWQMKKSWVPYFDDDMVSHVWSAERFWSEGIQKRKSHTVQRDSAVLWSNHMQHIHVWRNLYANKYTCVCILKSTQKTDLYDAVINVSKVLENKNCGLNLGKSSSVTMIIQWCPEWLHHC